MFRPTTLRGIPTDRSSGSTGATGARLRGSRRSSVVIPATWPCGRRAGATLGAAVHGTAAPTRRRRRTGLQRAVCSAEGLTVAVLVGTRVVGAAVSGCFTFAAARRGPPPLLVGGAVGHDGEDRQLQEGLDIVDRPQAAVHHRRQRHRAEGEEGADDGEESDGEHRLLDRGSGPSGTSGSSITRSRWLTSLTDCSVARRASSLFCWAFEKVSCACCTADFSRSISTCSSSGRRSWGPPGCVAAYSRSAVWACSSWPW